MSEPIFLKTDAVTVVVYSQSEARKLEDGGFVRCAPDPDAVQRHMVVLPGDGATPTANIRSQATPAPMAIEETPAPEPTFPDELSPGEYTRPPAKPKAKVVKK